MGRAINCVLPTITKVDVVGALCSRHSDSLLQNDRRRRFSSLHILLDSVFFILHRFRYCCCNERTKKKTPFAGHALVILLFLFVQHPTWPVGRCHFEVVAGSQKLCYFSAAYFVIVVHRLFFSLHALLLIPSRSRSFYRLLQIFAFVLARCAHAIQNTKYA